jgi:hypothetical protein
VERHSECRGWWNICEGKFLFLVLHFGVKHPWEPTNLGELGVFSIEGWLGWGMRLGAAFFYFREESDFMLATAAIVSLRLYFGWWTTLSGISIEFIQYQPIWATLFPFLCFSGRTLPYTWRRGSILHSQSSLKGHICGERLL